MKKIAVSLFVILLLVNIGLVFFQYNGFSEKGSSDEAKPFSYNQEIEVTYQDSKISIRHTFTNLPNETVKLIWPKSAKQIACEEGSCNRLTGDSATFKPGDTKQQIITYTIPVAGGLKGQTLLQQIFVQLEAGDAKTSTVHVTSYSGANGQWITGLPLSSTNALDSSTYTVFTGSGNVYDLYWQAGDIALKASTDKYSIYSAYNVTDKFLEELRKMGLEFTQHVAIIQAKKQDVHEHSRFIFMPQLNLAEVKTQIIGTQIASNYTFAQDAPAWLTQLVVAEIGETPMTEPRAEQMKAELDARLTDAQQSAFKAKLEALKGQTVTLEGLDEALSTIIGAKTTFFAKNGAADALYPLLEEEERGIYVNEVRIDALKAIQYNGLTYYTADVFLEQFGFKGGEGANGYYVTGNDQSYRFPVSQLFYVHNERRYDVKTRPVDKIGGQYYIEEAWLVRLFDVDVRKKDRVIEITTIQGEQ